MKKNKINIFSRFLDSVTTGHTKHEENEWIIEKMLAKTTSDQNKIKKQLTAGLLATGIALSATAVTLGIKNTSSPVQTQETPKITTQITTQQTQVNSKEEKPLPQLLRYGDESYYTYSKEDVLQMAQNSLAFAEQRLSKVNGITPVGLDHGPFYPEYFDASLMTAMAQTESDFRTTNANGVPFTSKSGALGMMQIRPQTLESVNYWLKNTMGINDLEYTIEDLSDAQKSMDVGVFYLISLVKNHGKEHCNNPLYTKLGEEFSLSRQKEIAIMLYNVGYDNACSLLRAGQLHNYLPEGSKTNYVNTVLKNELALKQELASINEQ